MPSLLAEVPHTPHSLAALSLTYLRAGAATHAELPQIAQWLCRRG